MSVKLSISARRLANIDEQIMRAARQRIVVAKEVATTKEVRGEPIFRPKVENDRLNDAVVLAKEIGLNPNFAHALKYLLIDESCKEQMIQIQGSDHSHLLSEDPDERYEQLKKNLIALTEAVAQHYDKSGGRVYPATKAYIKYENDEMSRSIGLLPENCRRVALDLGCGVGRTTRKLSQSFKKVIGYDLSQHMIDEAWKRGENTSNVSFKQGDLDDGIPLEDNSVDFVVMGLGTASDIRHANKLMLEISRVLHPRGRFLFSFYNRHALIYMEDYVSVDSGLAATINVEEQCLVVHAPGSFQTAEAVGRDYMVYAKAYDWGEIHSVLCSSNLTYDAYHTYPTMASVIPRSLLLNDEVAKKTARLDKIEADGASGAYYVVTGHNQ